MKFWCCLAIVVSSSSCSVLDKIGGRRVDAQYCAEHPDDSVCKNDPDGGEQTCKSNADCESANPVCDLAGAKTCVQCIAPDSVAACAGTSPVCRDDHACHACVAHADCPASNACLPDGACAAVADVAYVDPMRGAGSTCSHDAPCSKVADALAVRRPYLKLSGTIDEQIKINQDVTVLADPSTILTTTKNGVLVEINGSSNVRIYDLTITGASGSSGIGLSLPAGNSATLFVNRCTISNNAGGGVVASNGTITIARSTVSGNAAGGISLSGTKFDITNSFIVSNGGPSTAIGGVRLDQMMSGKFEFNTVSNNAGADGASLGVVCTLVTQPLELANNIVYGNQEGGARTQVGGANCNWRYSDIGQVGVSGTGNINADPLFVDHVKGNFHLQSTSPAKDKADPASTQPLDIDGETRPRGTARDIGADEI